jgi:hypothetical protein
VLDELVMSCDVVGGVLKGAYFRDWLLTKLINTERSAYKAPGFSHAIERTRKLMLQQLIVTLSDGAKKKK